MFTISDKLAFRKGNLAKAIERRGDCPAAGA
jgi:hypothetical protein